MASRGEGSKVALDKNENAERSILNSAANGMASGAADAVACRNYEARLADALEGATDADLTAHLAQCASCSVALERARLAGDWLRATARPAAEADGLFVARVMARIRNVQDEQATAGAFWAPVQSLASRMALAAGVAVLVLSLYVYKSAPRQGAAGQQGASVAANGEFPQPPAQPADKDEVLASLSGTHYGY